MEIDFKDDGLSNEQLDDDLVDDDLDLVGDDLDELDDIVDLNEPFSEKSKNNEP